jgi:hypothetical protein
VLLSCVATLPMGVGIAQITLKFHKWNRPNERSAVHVKIGAQRYFDTLFQPMRRCQRAGTGSSIS